MIQDTNIADDAGTARPEGQRAASGHVIVPLEGLRADEGGRVFEVEGDARLVHRLAEMGLRAGAAIRMIRAGQPCIVQVNHHRLSLRADHMLTILVELRTA